MGKSYKRDRHSGQGSSENRSESVLVMKAGSQTKRMKSSTYFSDPLLIPRINQYLSDNKDKIYVDINDMVTELQSQYRDYARRKRSAFKALVEKAFSFVLQQCGISQDNGEGVNNREETSGNSSSEVEECNISDGEESKTSSNNQLVNLYNSSQLQAMTKHYQACSNDNAELIDLSSDDESVKKKDVSEEKSASAAVIKLNNLQSRIANKETTLTVIKAGTQNHSKVDRPSVTITAKRSRDSMESSRPHLKSVKKKRSHFYMPKRVTFADFGGDPKVLEEVCKLILHISHPEIYREIGFSSPRGFLLHGPPGCGKTLLANAIAGELEVELIQISAPELIGGVSGESEERIRDLFDKAVFSAPCVLFIDEVDAICPKRQYAQKEMERRIVAQLLTCLDELNSKPNGDLVLVIGATNRPDSIDPALRRAGRFDREVSIGIPDLKSREKILRVMCADLNLSSNFSYEELAQNTPGYVGADLLALTREAAMIAINRLFCMMQNFKSKENYPKHKRQKTEKHSPTKTTPNKETHETMDIDLVEPGGSKDKSKSDTKSENEKPESSENEQPSSSEKEQPDNSQNESSENGEKIDSTGSNENEDENEKDKEKQDQETPMEVSEKEEKEKDNVETGASKASSEDSPGQTDTSKDETKTSLNESETDVEVISDSVPKQPSLETLLYWLRDSSPLPYHHLKHICISQDDFRQALNFVQPSAKREGFVTVPNVTWDDIGSLADVREELKMCILGPVKYRKQFEQLGLTTPAGVLICGPPGCGKTLLAKAVANEAGINFISVKGPEFLNMYVGESERAVRLCFQRARNSAPCVIFFDELDALCPRRTDSAESGAIARVVNQLLIEMDGVEDRKEVYLMAATNRPDIVDPAVLRPGRLDKIIYVGLPKAEDRADILRALTKNGSRPKLGKDVDLTEIALRKECDGYSGADLAALIREAAVQAVKDIMAKPEVDSSADVTVNLSHFEKALSKIRPSVPLEYQKYYENVRRMVTNGKSLTDKRDKVPA